VPDPLYSGRYTQAFTIAASSQQIRGSPREDGKPTPYCSGIHALTSGTVTAIFKEDIGNGPVTFPVVAGTLYPYSLTFVTALTDATLLGLL
jgi:hypothetical protein